MDLIFFKAGPPYNKTTGFWQQRSWTNGFTGPVTMTEAQRLSAALGGRYFTINLPHITSITQFLTLLGAELPEGIREDVTPIKKVAVSEVAEIKKEERDIKTLVSMVMESPDKTNRERLESVMDEIPAYAEQVRKLADSKADGSFNYTDYIGKKRDVSSILKMYTILMLKDNFELK